MGRNLLGSTLGLGSERGLLVEASPMGPRTQIKGLPAPNTIHNVVFGP